MKIQVYDILKYILMFQFYFLALFLLTSKKGKRVSNRILAFFLFSKASCYLNGLLFKYKAITLNLPYYFFFTFHAFEYLLGPVIYFYTKSLMYKDFTFKKRDVLHLLPFLFYIGILYQRFYRVSAEIMLRFINGPGHPLTMLEQNLRDGAIYFLFLVYTIFTLWEIRKYQMKLKSSYSALEKINLSWLQFIVFGFTIIWTISSIKFMLKLFSGTTIPYWSEIFIIILFTYANTIVFKGLRQPEIFHGIKFRYIATKAFISETTYEKYVNKLEQFMEHEKPFLNPAITINELAERAEISARTLSYIINKKYKMNFFDFINQYRIKESKRLLSDASKVQETILSVLYDAGFNSKSVFNRAFRKFEGITPSQFRKQIHAWFFNYPFSKSIPKISDFAFPIPPL